MFSFLNEKQQKHFLLLSLLSALPHPPWEDRAALLGAPLAEGCGVDGSRDPPWAGRCCAGGAGHGVTPWRPCGAAFIPQNSPNGSHSLSLAGSWHRSASRYFFFGQMLAAGDGSWLNASRPAASAQPRAGMAGAHPLPRGRCGLAGGGSAPAGGFWCSTWPWARPALPSLTSPRCRAGILLPPPPPMLCPLGEQPGCLRVLPTPGLRAGGKEKAPLNERSINRLCQIPC